MVRTYFTIAEVILLVLWTYQLTTTFIYAEFSHLRHHASCKCKKVLLVGFYGEMIFHRRQLFKSVQVSDLVLF